MSAQVVQLPPGCKIVEAAPSAPQTAAMFEGYPDLLTPDDMAEIIRQSAQTVRKLMRSGEIPNAFKIGAFWYVAKADFAEFVERGKRGAA
ncbi:helix-turn-helix domain-containing protein [uncultured Adlercreutzia sp.]|uniref:helix-turn-helix domain-containing protein n=1 Tax=uncultured Adlercreutzia sp. TaxID=875803 RepID=UPI00266D0EC9|nr:helix-turn-helix domain-containing protein [uncultured Adlercreutzia sp.]